VLLVPKKNQTFRLVVDYRRLNAATDSLRYALPTVQSVLDALSGARCMSTLDLKSGYLQVGLTPGAERLCAFVTPFGVFKFRRMPFGLKNAPRHFQYVMDSILHDLGKFVRVYLDDIVVFSSSFQEHGEHLSTVFAVLSRHGLVLNADKCHFFCKEVALLGFIVSGSGVRADPAKTAAVDNWCSPTSRVGVQAFCGFANYFRSFISQFAHKMAPLYAALRGDKFDWTQAQQTAFDVMKRELGDLPSLSHPRFDRPFYALCDASHTAAGGVLCQRDEADGPLRPIAYFSKAFNPAQLNYATLEKELLAIVLLVTKYAHYLAAGKCHVQTDHRNIVSLVRKAVARPVARNRVARWVIALGAFDLEFEYVKGSENVAPDALSRAVVASVFQRNVTIVEAQHASADVWKWRDTEPDKFVLIDGLLYRKFGEYMCLVVPPSLYRRYLRAAHDDRNHFGIAATWQYLKLRTWWPHQKQIMASYIAACHHCQVRTTGPQRPSRQGFLQPVVTSDVFALVALDFTGPCPTDANGHRWICTIIDHFSGFVQFYAVKDQSAKSASACLLRWCMVFGVPERVLTDRGAAFTSAMFAELCAKLNIARSRTTAYHPQANGRCERVHGVLRKIDWTEGWVDRLPLIAFGINTMTTSDRTLCPYTVVFGIPPLTRVLSKSRVQRNDATDSVVLDANEHLVMFALVRDFARSAQAARRALSKARYDVGQVSVSFEVNDLVLLSVPQPRGVTKKEYVPWSGPWRVSEVISPLVYRIDTDRGDQVVSVQRLKAYIPQWQEADVPGAVVVLDDADNDSDDEKRVPVQVAPDDDDDDDDDDDGKVELDGDTSVCKVTQEEN